jgi:pSer/pThr/pTyr-binding forkhead associated (FHA) protein
MNVSLVMFKVDGTRWDFAVDKPRIVIGRTSNCDLRIPLSSVSRQHCEVRLDNGQVKLRDLGSSNGTYHNHIRVQEVSLKPGDEIVVGPVAFTVVIDGQPSTVAQTRSVIGNAGQEAAAEPVEPEKPQQIEVAEDDDELPALIEADTHTPTVDLDDPISALQALADMEDSGELPLLSEEDDDEPPAKAK